MDGILAGLENWPVATYFRDSRWGYATLNAAHIFGIAFLIGSTVPMNLRMLGLWRNVNLASLIRVLMPMAVCGLVLAMLTGLLLFSTRSGEYADIGIFQIKLLLVCVGSVSAVALHWKFGMVPEALPKRRRTGHAIVSLLCWPGVLICGRFIAFAD